MSSVSADGVSSRTGPAFSRLLDVESLPDGGLETAIEATAAECAAVAADIELPAVGALAARYRITRRPDGRLEVAGVVTARVTQTCTVSLDPFESEIEETVEATFAPVAKPFPDRHIGRANVAASRRKASAKPPPPVHLNAEEDDPPDPIVDGRIDLGALAVEFLTLALDFCPRRPGVEFHDVVVGETEAPKPSAFAVLERLKDRS